MSATDPLIYDWNSGGWAGGAGSPRGVAIDDETLRDGLQSPSVRIPTLDEKMRLLHLMAGVGVAAVDVGLPGAGPRASADAEALCREIATAGLALDANCAARTTEGDIVPILEIMQRVGRELEIALFLGASPIRGHVEGWPFDELLRRAEISVRFAVERGARVNFVTEDTTRSHPNALRSLLEAALRAGATRICVADTAGHATPLGALRLVRFVRKVAANAGFADVGIDWHGHNDRGLAVANALTAAWAGANRLHATVLGVGERVGNPPLEQLLVNARLLGWATPELGGLEAYVRQASEILRVAIPPWAPVVGKDAFRTSTGVHAAAILKAESRGESELADLVYSAVPASWLERRQEIDVGPMSGGSNVRHWLLAHGYEANAARVERIFAAAKVADHTLSDEELHVLARGETLT
jgi:isopropylmalate/homocitrate/citramalate synthase